MFIAPPYQYCTGEQVTYSTDMWRRERSKEEESPAPLYSTDMWRCERSKEESPAPLYSTDMWRRDRSKEEEFEETP
jgi:hypothetical protein